LNASEKGAVLENPQSADIPVVGVTWWHSGGFTHLQKPGESAEAKD